MYNCRLETVHDSLSLLPSQRRSRVHLRPLSPTGLPVPPRPRRNSGEPLSRSDRIRQNPQRRLPGRRRQRRPVTRAGRRRGMLAGGRSACTVMLGRRTVLAPPPTARARRANPGKRSWQRTLPNSSTSLYCNPHNEHYRSTKVNGNE